MGMAEIAVALWHRHLRHSPANPRWANRDRFVLSNGHGSMLQYALLHLTGYALPLDEIRRFRQLHSMTPGHPEVGVTPGVETTTGPLGQGLANAVGMALAERLLAAEFNRPGHAIVDHHTYVFAGDGCLMEGISHEACSLAGTLGLAKLVCFYDDNGISIDGEVKGWFTDDTPRRFEAYGWQVIPGVDGHDVDAVDAAIRRAHASTERPTLICCKTIIGKGSPHRAGTDLAHGQALGEKEVALTREALGWTFPPFVIPPVDIRRMERACPRCGARARMGRPLCRVQGGAPGARRRIRAAHGRRTANRLRRTRCARSCSSRTRKPRRSPRGKPRSRRSRRLAPVLPELIGGSADLTGSVFTNWSGSKAVVAREAGNYINFGVREFAMSAIANGLALHGGFIPYVGTFLTFSDYARNALRMAALMKLRSISVYTHDSIGLGEDGPTHQSVEHASSLRLIPNLDVWRPCDTVESALAWIAAIERENGPSCLLFTRQNVPFNARDRGADRRDSPRRLRASRCADAKAVIIATGSEVSLAVGAQKVLADAGIPVRVVSMPCTNVFDRQDAAWRESVLPRGIPRVAVEAGITDFWRKYVGAVDDPHGAVVGIDRFGESAPGGVLFKHFGFTIENVVATVKNVL